MALRPTATHWFELLVAREDLMAAVEVLANSSRVELEGRGEPSTPLVPTDFRHLLDELDALEQLYGAFWPKPRARQPDGRGEPRALLDGALQRLRDWRDSAAPVVDRLREQLRERDDLFEIDTLIRDAGVRLPDLRQLSAAGPMLEARVYLLAAGTRVEALPASVIAQPIAAEDRNFLLAVGLQNEMQELDRIMQLQKARQVQLPDIAADGDSAASSAIRARLDALAAGIEEARHDIESLNERFAVSEAIADAHFVRWYMDSVPALETTEHFAWISGWTSFQDDESLLRLLAGQEIKGLLRLTEPPQGLEPPLVLTNPRWMQPFELFSGTLGVPGAAEADPTPIVAVVAPLMFGYMFGDVGHGAVLLVAGLVFGRRYPALKLLIAGGLVSIVFGFLYGSVFAIETLIEPLWLHPLAHPILMMLVPLAGGAALLIIGMLLEALQAYWQRKARFWWETGAGLLLCYLALLGSFFDARLLIVAAIGAVWFVAGHAVVATVHRLAAAGTALTELVESMLQILVNTLSFVRVGAFALAHAGLSLAVVGVAEAPQSLVGKALILVLGNALIIGLEGLIVGIQTTRLVLFEFFVRFLHAEGRPFRPILLPRNQSKHP